MWTKARGFLFLTEIKEKEGKPIGTEAVFGEMMDKICPEIAKKLSQRFKNLGAF